MNEESRKIIRAINRYLTEYDPLYSAGSVHTCRSHEIAIRSYVEWLENPNEINSEDLSVKHFEAKWLEDWCKYLVDDKKIQKQSVNVRLSSMKSFLKYLSKQDAAFLYLYEEESNARYLKCSRAKVSGISREGIKALMEAPNISTATGRKYLMAMILCYNLALNISTATGRKYLMAMILCYNLALRIDELLSIRIKDIQLGNKHPYIIIHGKGEKTRSLFMMERTVSHLKEYLQEFHQSSDPTAYLFNSNYKGKHQKLSQTTFRTTFKKYAEIARSKCEDVPADIHPHMLRHARATHMLEDGLNIAQVSEFLGHASINTTQVYLDISFDLKSEAMQKLENEEINNMPKKWKAADNTTSILSSIVSVNRKN